MKPAALLVLLACPILASAQQERAADVRATPLAAPAFIGSAPASIALTSPSLAFAAPSAAIFAAAPALSAPAAGVPAALTAAAPASIEVKAAAPAGPAALAPRAAAGVQLREGARPGAPAVDAGRSTFDGGLAALRAPDSVVAGAAAGGEPVLGRPVQRAASPAPSIPLRQRAGETIELGALAFGFQLLTGIAFLMFGGHSAFPGLAGAFWVLAGTEMIKQLGKLRGFVVGGWQASHDQEMRTDYGTGQLKDIRGHKYGEDRYDVFAPGRVSRRARFIVDAAAVAAGLPWVASSGPKGVALYAAGAAAAFAARAAWRRLRPEPEGLDKQPNYEPDR